MSQPHPFATLFNHSRESEAPQLSPEAQAENLRAAWEHYTSPKDFRPGQILRNHSLLGSFVDNPLLLFVRKLSNDSAADVAILSDALAKTHANKVDCIVMLLKPDASALFHATDSDTLEPYEA